MSYHVPTSSMQKDYDMSISGRNSASPVISIIPTSLACEHS